MATDRDATLHARATACRRAVQAIEDHRARGFTRGGRRELFREGPGM